MKYLHSGKFVRITASGDFLVHIHRGGLFRPEQKYWQIVDAKDVDLNSYRPWLIDSPYGKFALDGTDLTHKDISHILKIPRLDRKRAVTIWNDPCSKGGRSLRIDFLERELTYARVFDDLEPCFVVPFSHFRGVRIAPIPHLVRQYKIHTYDIPLGNDFPLSPHDLAAKMGIPILEPE